MLRQTVEPDIVSYNAVISACEKGQELRRAFGVCAEMLRQALAPNKDSYRAFLPVPARSSRPRVRQSMFVW